jgi:hypothetical integral membrane protein (TIGR02206 family)
MPWFFARDYYGPPFVLFGPPHLAALAAVMLVNVWIVAWRRRFTPGQRRALRYTLAGVLVVVESLWHWWNWAIGAWSIRYMLPLHICSILVWLSAYMLLTGNRTIYEFSYFLGLAAASQVLITPDAGPYGFPHFRFFQVILSHGAIVTTAVYMTAVEGYRPYWSSVKRVLITLNVYGVFILLLNFALNSNYLFIHHVPETPSLIDMLGPWPWYILALEGIAIFAILLLYLPWAIKDRRAQVTSATPS